MKVTTVTRLVYVRGVAEVGEPVLVVGAVLPGGALLAALTTPGPGSSTRQQQQQRQETLHISFTTSPPESAHHGHRNTTGCDEHKHWLA